MPLVQNPRPGRGLSKIRQAGRSVATIPNPKMKAQPAEQDLADAKRQFADALRAWRLGFSSTKHGRKLTQAEAAERMSTSLDVYRKWEHGVTAPTGPGWDAAWRIILGSNEEIPNSKKPE